MTGLLLTFGQKKLIIIMISFIKSNERQKGTEMKKIISLLLAFASALILFSCGSDSSVDKFVKIVSSSEPTKIITQTSYSDSENTLRGRYETIIYGDDFEMSYSYQNYQMPGAGVNPDDFIATYEGKIYYHDGLYSSDGGLTWNADIPGETTMQVKFDIKKSLLGDYEISKDKKTLTSTVTDENAEKILGIKISANEDGVNLTIVHDGQNIRNILISYVAESGATVSYETSYSYSAVTSPFEEGPGGEE